MKAHISKLMVAPGGKFLCGTANARTSGISATVAAFKTEWSHMQCDKCRAILHTLEEKMAKRATRG